MQILYNDKTDLLYLRLDERKQQVINRRRADNIVLDLGEDSRIVGIEILDASKHLNLEGLLPVRYHVSLETAPASAQGPTLQTDAESQPVVDDEIIL